MLVGRPTALSVSPSPTYQQCFWHNTEVGRRQCTARTFRMLRTHVSAMIYQALKIEIRHGSARRSVDGCLAHRSLEQEALHVSRANTEASTKEKKIANKKRLYQAHSTQATYCLAYRHPLSLTPDAPGWWIVWFTTQKRVSPARWAAENVLRCRSSLAHA